MVSGTASGLKVLATIVYGINALKKKSQHLWHSWCPRLVILLEKLSNFITISFNINLLVVAVEVITIAEKMSFWFTVWWVPPPPHPTTTHTHLIINGMTVASACLFSLILMFKKYVEKTSWPNFFFFLGGGVILACKLLTHWLYSIGLGAILCYCVRLDRHWHISRCTARGCFNL